MDYKRAIGISSSFLFLVLIAFKFQNCGSGAPEEAFSDVTDDQRIVDDFSQAKVSFVEQLIIVSDDTDETLFHGTCARKSSGLVLVAKVIDVETREEISSVSSECYPGGFTLNVPKISDLDCTKDYVLSVESVDGDKALLNLRRKCTPVKKLFLASVEQEGGQYSCFIEKQNSNSKCEKVCYVDNKLYSRDEVDEIECD